MIRGTIRRKNDFLLLREQDEEESKGGPYTPSPERILQQPDVADGTTEKNASVDQIIDRYLLQYEKEAVPLNDEPTVSGPKPIGESHGWFYRYLFEQDAPPGGDASPPAGDAGGASPSGDSGTEPGEAAKVAPVPFINIRKFAEGIARLVNNYKTLVDPETVILNRAMYYISKNYSARLAKELMSILQRDFNLSPKTVNQREQESPAAPRAGNSGPDSGGGVPSGGGSSSGGS
jgi:hypothetical protein